MSNPTEAIAAVIEDHTWGTGHSSPDECWCGESFGNPQTHAAHVAAAVLAALREERAMVDPDHELAARQILRAHIDDERLVRKALGELFDVLGLRGEDGK